MFTETLTYFHDTTPCKAFIAYDSKIEAKRPVVLIAHAWRGQDDFAREKAIFLGTLGYIGFAIDMYGEGKHTTSNEEASKLMAPFFLDRSLLQKRVQAAYTFIRSHPKVDQEKIGAMGFCFGGLVVYELLRSGADIKGAVCFHGVFANEIQGQKAKLEPIHPDTRGKLLILHGADDPMVSDDDLHYVEKEMTKSGIDWQIHIYGNTMHAFTNPKANDPKMGTVYQETSAIRAFRSMQLFFEEIF